MKLQDHVWLTGTALTRWLIAQTADALAMAMLWLIGLLLIGVPLAPLWAVLGGLLQFIPGMGTVLAVIGPAIAGVISGGFERLLLVLTLYAVLVVIDGLILQPYLMNRTARVPIWASIVAPVVLGVFFGFWGVLLAAPLLAVIYVYRTLRVTDHRSGGSEG